MFETTGRATRGKAVEMEDVKFHQCVRLSSFIRGIRTHELPSEHTSQTIDMG
jgi:hypothetical protein